MNPRLELHFVEPTGGEPKLAWTFFERPAPEGRGGPLRSQMFETHQPRDASLPGLDGSNCFRGQFQWSASVPGLAVLFLRSKAARLRGDTRFVYRKLESELAASLFHAVRRADAWFKCRWLPKMFAAQDEKDDWWRGLFESDDTEVWVALDRWVAISDGPQVQNPVQPTITLDVKVTRNESELKTADELDALADRIEGKRPLGVEIHVGVWRPGERRYVSIGDTGVLPVSWDTRVRLTLVPNQPAYLSLIWLDGSGEATPLYPWRDFDWKKPDKIEKVSEFVSPGVPDHQESPFRIEGQRGLETVIVLADVREPDPDQLRGLYKCFGIPRENVQRGSPLAVRGRIKPDNRIFPFTWRGQPGMYRFNPNAPVARDPDPIAIRHHELAGRLTLAFPYFHAVSFANGGR